MVRKIYRAIIDRPIGYKDNFGNCYPINYGYIPDLFAGDGEEQDVYIISEKIREPLESFEGELIAVIHRQNDVEDKWVLTSTNENITIEDIKEKTYFWNNILLPLLNYCKGEIMTLAKDIARDLLKIEAVYLKPEEPFTWASGIKSPIYTDNRVTLAYPETRTLIENGFVEKIKAEFPEVEVIAGTATAGIPHGAIIADKMNLPFAYIRSKPKDHGAGNQIEGRVKSGQKMVVVEDLISTGGSVLDAVVAAKREGADVIGVVAIFTYELPRAEKNFSDAGVKLVTLSNYTELINLAEQEGYVSAEGLALLEKFKHDQENWQG